MIMKDLVNYGSKGTSGRAPDSALKVAGFRSCWHLVVSFSKTVFVLISVHAPISAHPHLFKATCVLGHTGILVFCI